MIERLRQREGDVVMIVDERKNLESCRPGFVIYAGYDAEKDECYERILNEERGWFFTFKGTVNPYTRKIGFTDLKRRFGDELMEFVD